MKIEGLKWDTMTRNNLERHKLSTKAKPVTDRHNSDHLQRCHSKCHGYGMYNILHYKTSIQVECRTCWEVYHRALQFEQSCQRPALLYTTVHRKTLPEIHFIHLCKNKIYYIFKTCCIISGLYSAKCHLFHNFICFCSNNTHVSHKPCTKI
jgi:hypothetical protein